MKVSLIQIQFCMYAEILKENLGKPPYITEE